MSACDALAANASAGAAPALRAVDCLANETAASAFGRLFGGDGALLPALTILLTLYIAFFAISLLTGRSRIGISALTPRMITLGLVLTFATSWIAYQSVVWNLATGAPDELAGILMGAKGSATTLFADRIDIVFGAIAEAATNGGVSAQGGAAGATAGSFTPANLMWLAALLLLLGTVGILLTARIALAVLLATGPIFVVLALFGGTRGLFVGWLRGVVLTAVTPLFVVVGGGIVLELLVPILGALVSEGVIDGRAAMALFLIAAVHCALMAMVLRVSGTIVSGWQVFGLAAGNGEGRDRGPTSAPPATAIDAPIPALIPAAAPRRSFALASAGAPATVMAETAPAASAAFDRSHTMVTQQVGAAPSLPPLPAQRGRGVGSRFRARPHQFREMIR